MDTRSKILKGEEAVALARGWRAQGTGVCVVTGHFDVLLAEHIRELARVRSTTETAKLLVVLTPPPDPVLADRARAELVAALGVVDYVVIAEPAGREELLAALEAGDVAAFEAADAGRTRQLIEHVHRRQAG